MAKENKRRTIKRVLTLCLLFLLIYVTSYCILSAFGTYGPSFSGKTRFNVGLSMIDINVWYPKYAHGHLFVNISGNRVYRGNCLGYFYAPLITLDQHFIHKTIHLLELDKKDKEAERRAKTIIKSGRRFELINDY